MTRRYGTAPSDYRPQVNRDPARPEPESALEKQIRREKRYGYTRENTDERADYLAYEDRMWAEEASALDPEDMDEGGTAWRIYLQSREDDDG